SVDFRVLLQPIGGCDCIDSGRRDGTSRVAIPIGRCAPEGQSIAASHVRRTGQPADVVRRGLVPEVEFTVGARAIWGASRDGDRHLHYGASRRIREWCEWSGIVLEECLVCVHKYSISIYLPNWNRRPLEQ